MGAAGRDFHNFNRVYRDNSDYRVIAFTAAQIPNISGKKYPPELAGKLYPDGIPIYAEEELVSLIHRENVDLVVFSYSDISHEAVMHKASLVMAHGANFQLLGAKATMVKSTKPVVSITAVRTGCGKSPISRKIGILLRQMGKRAVVIRHPMPYGDLTRQIWQRFASVEDMVRQDCTIEEMEEYEPHIANGLTVFAGIDYEKILREAEKEADVIIWDGGNNDYPFITPTIDLVVTDPHRPGHELRYFPGETNFLRGKTVIIPKIDSADPENVRSIEANVAKFNPEAQILKANLTIGVDDPAKIKGKKVLVVEDGPTLTHGEMLFGAGVLAAKRFGAAEMIDPRPYLVGDMAETFKKYPHVRGLLPAMGYSGKQVKDLEETIRRTPCDTVLIATPVDLRRIVKIDQASCRVQYECEEIGTPDLKGILSKLA